MLVAVVSSNCSYAQEYHFTEGFNVSAGDNVVPIGWSAENTYPSKTRNHGLYIGERTVKFNKGYSYLITPECVSAGVLNYWVALDSTKNDGNEKIFVELSKDGGSFEFVDSCLATEGDIGLGWTEHSITIDDSVSSIQFRFTVEYTDPESSSPKSALYIDDISLTDIQPTNDSTEVLDSTIYANRFYVDAENGNDDNSGKSEVLAWKTLAKINAETFVAGDTILLKSDNVWYEVLEPQGSGTIDSSIVITSYKSGDKPIVDGQGELCSDSATSASLRLFNQEYWEIENIHVQNYAADEVSDPQLKYGILIQGENSGTLHGFTLNNVEVSNVNGDVDVRKNGGVAFVITRSDAGEVVSNFDGITIEDSYFHDVSNAGVFTSSDWDHRDFSTSFGETTSIGKTNDWYPSLNIVVRNNRFEKIAGNGMVIRISDGALAEYNTFYMCGLTTTGNASYPYNSDNALWQFNEASHTVYNNGDADASGFDSDYFCKNTIIQYNYSHDNDYGSVLVCSNGNIARAFNDNTIIRYNIFQNDGHHMVRMSGSTTNTYIYNNVFYASEDMDNNDLLWHKEWGDGAYPDQTNYSNNIFYNLGPNTSYVPSSSTNNIFSNNIFFGNTWSNEPSDANKITSDPLFVDPGKGDFGFTTLDGYKLQDDSPAIGAGIRMTDEVINDFFGNEISQTSGITIGAYHVASAVGVENNGIEESTVAVFPNPADTYTTVNISSSYRGLVNVNVISLDGKIVKSISFSKNSELVSHVINLVDVELGTYIVTVETDAVSTMKIIKN